jgi:hypothetical protein
MEKTCLHRFFGDCKDCKEDYEPITQTHPVNNYCCKRYYEIRIIKTNIMTVKFSVIDKMHLTIGHFFGRNGDLKGELLEKKVKELETK